MPKQISDDQVFQAVIRLLIERGYDGATTKELARAAEMSEVSLFRKYGSKSQLVIEALSHHGEILTLSKVGFTGDIEADLLLITSLYHDAAERHGELFATMLSEMPRHAELKGALQRPLMMIQTIEGIIERYQELGTLREEPTMHVVAALLGPIMNLTLISKAMPEKHFPPLDLKAYVTHFLEGRRA
ncbi:MAG: helix-turn-helix domain-containing protein [Ardenticatenaceae bacterium]|nr:helix-turn-helix domain-containing protein [Ardenticatenaceae bacterium]